MSLAYANIDSFESAADRGEDLDVFGRRVNVRTRSGLDPAEAPFALLAQEELNHWHVAAVSSHRHLAMNHATYVGTLGVLPMPAAFGELLAVMAVKGYRSSTPYKPDRTYRVAETRVGPQIALAEPLAAAMDALDRVIARTHPDELARVSAQVLDDAAEASVRMHELASFAGQVLAEKVAELLNESDVSVGAKALILQRLIDNEELIADDRVWQAALSMLGASNSRTAGLAVLEYAWLVCADPSRLTEAQAVVDASTRRWFARVHPTAPGVVE